MEDQLTQWLFDPTVDRLATVLIGIEVLRGLGEETECERYIIYQ